MQCFGEFRDQAVHSLVRVPKTLATKAFVQNVKVATLEHVTSSSLMSYVTDEGIALAEKDIRDQFVVFQFGQSTDGPTILDTSEVVPKLEGNEDKPDALAILQLASFHVGEADQIDKDARATLRVDFGKDSNSSSSLDAVFWSIAAGLNLYNEFKKKPSDAKDLKSDFNEAFSHRPIEIAGGLGRLSFEVVKHQEPKWWQKIFSFLQSGTGKALTSAVGFPAITSQAIGFIDELLNKLDKSNPEILFKSRPMTLALTKRARDAFNAGVPSVSVGVLNPGFCLLARGRDYKTIVAGEPGYMGAYGLLKPKAVKLEDFLQGNYNDPFKDVTYAVLRVGSAETRLNPQLNFGA